MTQMSRLGIVTLGIFIHSIAYAIEPSTVGAIKVEQGMSNPSQAFATYEQLSADDKELLRRGEISQAQLLAGGFLGTFIGFGSGHIPYQMYRSRGWVFTVGESGALLLALLGASRINNNCTTYVNGARTCADVSGSRLALVAGAAGFVGLRIWEIIDVWSIPSERNYDVRGIRQKMGRELTRADWAIYPAAYLSDSRNTVLPGIECSFRF